MTGILLIDESGDTGIARLREGEAPGSSPYFVMGAALLQPAGLIRARQVVQNAANDFGKTKIWKHATDLPHMQKVHLSKELAKLPARYFALISHKPTLGEYASEISMDPHMFYNKCSKYLLELVGKYLSYFPELAQPQVVFEKRNHDYDKLIRYIAKVKGDPIYPQSEYLKYINPFGIVSKSKNDEISLRVPDMISHAVYTCITKGRESFSHTEPRYVSELSARFAADRTGRVIGAGIKLIHSLESLRLPDHVKSDLIQLRAMPRPKSAA